ncbi:MAG: DUF2884 family protein [candidate division Zixibacteria bacterium]|nr:DUF2884 family protein [candidate division Zixibacteria bacterium]
MKTFSIVLLAALLAVPSAAFGHSRHYHSSTSHSHSVSVSTDLFDNGSRNIDFKGKRIFIKYDSGTPRRVEVNDRHELRVDGSLVKLNRDQHQLVGEFYDKTQQLVADAKAIGLEGAAIGLQGAGVAAAALTGVVNMLFTSYTSDDLERDVERKAAKIEAKADRLEAKADKLEMLADEVQDLYDQMEDSIPELRGDI